MYGTQTTDFSQCTDMLFENDVKMYGTQTNTFGKKRILSLRMM